jgi:hypothetical protein
MFGCSEMDGWIGRMGKAGLASHKAQDLRDKLTQEGLKKKSDGGKKAGRGRPEQVKDSSPEPIRSQSRDLIGAMVGD